MTWKEGLNIWVWNSPGEFNATLHSWTKSGFIDSKRKPDFLLEIVKNEAERSEIFGEMLVFLSDYKQLWIAYPKKSSKKYKAIINRDSGWGELGLLDFEGVRQIASDEDRSALRFRKTKYITTMNRKFSTKDQ